MSATEPCQRASKKVEVNMRLVRLGLAAFLLLAVFAAAVPAQNKKKGDDQTRSVQGVITSADDAVVNGAVVQLKNTKTLQIRSFITKENGVYYFHGLSPDVDYEIKADYNGATGGPKTLSSFDSRKEATLNLKLNKKETKQ